MAKYDYKSIHKYVQMHSDLIDTVILGMSEDWWWTASEVYVNGRFLVDLLEEPKIAGITGSSWATPTMQVDFKDGSQLNKYAFIGDVDSSKKPSWFSLGIISQEVQDERDGKFLN